VPQPFLSPEWIAQVKAIRDKYAGQATPLAHKVRMNLVVTGAPFGDGSVRAHVDTTSGDLLVEQGSLDDAEVTVTTDYETARKLFVDQDQQAAMQAFLGGKIKVQGDMTKLLALQGAAPDATAQQIADEVKAITA
jgi:hypothetical protein